MESPAPASPRLQALLAERDRRRQAARLLASQDATVAAAMTERLAAAIAALRAPQDRHDLQRAALRTGAAQVAILATRRAGKTGGGNREDLACALERPRFRATYCNATRAEAEGLAWRSDTEDGWIDLLARYGELDPRRPGIYHIGGLWARVNETKLSITFSNGSKLDIFAADRPGALDKFRGRAKHRVRIDEAQKFPDLARFCGPVCSGVLKDYRGQLVVQGTPGEDCAGFYYEITKPADHGPRLAGWEVHEYGVTDNPFFGATPEERFDRAVRPELDEKGLAIDDPGVQREWFKRWVREGSRHVYAVHSAPPQNLGWAPVRSGESWRSLAPLVRSMTPQVIAALADGGWYEHERAVADLPARPNGKPRRWVFGLGVDFGNDPDPVALVIPAFSPDLPDVYEMWSWKRVGMVPDDWRCLIELVYRQIPNDLLGIVGDPGGLVGANMQAWRERLGLPIENADKAGKRAWQEMLNGDIRRGRFWYRKDSALLDEHRHLIRLPGAPGKVGKEHADRRLQDGRLPGNHCADATLYIYRHFAHHLHRDPPGKGDRLAQEERDLEDAAERMSLEHDAEERARKEDERWDIVEW